MFQLSSGLCEAELVQPRSLFVHELQGNNDQGIETLYELYEAGDMCERAHEWRSFNGFPGYISCQLESPGDTGASIGSRGGKEAREEAFRMLELLELFNCLT